MKRKVVVLLLTVCMAGSSVALPVHAAPGVVSEDQGTEYQEDMSLDLDFEEEEDAPEILAENLTCGDYTYSLLANKTAVITKYNGNATQVAIPASLNGSLVARIGDSAFKGNVMIEGVSIPKSVEYINARAFANCSCLKTVTLNEGLKNIAYGAFYQCTSLKSIVIPSTVTSVGSGINGAFEDCSGLTSVTLKGKWIGDSMFEGCSSLKSVTIPKNVTRVGHSAFKSCSSLEKVVCEAAGSIGNSAFEDCPYLTSITLKNTTSIGQETFAGLTITKIDIPATCTQIGYQAFSNCKNLSSVTLHDGLKTIAGYAFLDCTALKSITFPNTLNTIGSSAFQSTSLSTLTIPKSVNEINTDAFKNCAKLKNVTFYNSGYVGNSAFVGCSALTSIDMSKSNIKAIYDRAFQGVPITSFTAPKTLSEIGDYAFQESKVESVVLNDGLAKIYDGAFYKCTKLKSVNIPYTVSYCGAGSWMIGCFQECSSLVDVAINNRLIGCQMFYNCTSLKTVVLPEVVNEVRSDAFAGCTKLTKAIFLGNAPTTVGSYIFKDTASGFTINYMKGKKGWTNPWNGYKTKQITKLSGDVKAIFEDVTPKDWYVDAVQFVFDNGYMSGPMATQFVPNKALTRAEFVTVLFNKENAPAQTYKKTFSDVPQGQWYTNAVMWAVNKKITAGVGGGKFGTNTTITREQLATMLYSYAKEVKKVKMTSSSTALNGFSDKSKISSWAMDAMKWAVTNKIMNGKAAKVLDPKGQATRAECAQMIKNYCDKYGKK